MPRRDRSSLPRLSRLRRLTRLCFLGLPLVGVGCVDPSPLGNVFLAPPPVVRAAAADPEPVAAPKAKPVDLAPPGSPPLSSPSQGGEGREALAPHVVPISLDAILHLAEDQNLKIGFTREKVNEADAQFDLACKHWLPDLYVGAAYYRHEGGIQNEDGTLTKSSTGAVLAGLDARARLDLREYAYAKVIAERKAHEQKAELEKITYETLVDATATYIDLLLAKSARAIAADMAKELQDLLTTAIQRADTVPAARVEVPRIRAELEARRANIHKFDAQAAAATAKLIYLLGLDPCTQLVPVDTALMPIDLVDANEPLCDLLARALQDGPGIHPLEAIVSLIEDAAHRAQGFSRFMPVFESQVTEGGFWAGADSDLAPSNRLDASFKVSWKLSDWHYRCEQRRIAHAQQQQAHLAYADLQAKLTASVQASREEILNGRPEIEGALGQMKNAEEARKLARERLRDTPMEGSPSEVLLTMQAVGIAQINRLTAIRDYDKAQLQLMIVTGGCRLPPAPPVPPAVEQLPAPKEKTE